MTTIAILATLDTKGDEAEFLRARFSYQLYREQHGEEADASADR